MESFFFNITDRAYKTTDLRKDKHNDAIFDRVDISNGIVFFQIATSLENDLRYTVRNLDRMLVICVNRAGAYTLTDTLSRQNVHVHERSIDIYLSSKQRLELTLHRGEHDVFVLFIADFILKRHTTSNPNDIVDLLYNRLQEEIVLERIGTQPVDALSLYLIEKITQTKRLLAMRSLVCEQYILEFLVHRFRLLDLVHPHLDQNELSIAQCAKRILLETYLDPPTIKTIAHRCATNETKLKSAFKKRYATTIYRYVQHLRLQQANFLLQDRSFTSIKEVANAVGYKHQGRFSQLFFDHYGVYPKDLLKK